MDYFELTKNILRANLQLGSRADALTLESPLMGNLPELNSLTVMSIVSSIEEETGCAVSDMEISADIFATVGTLVAFIERKSS